MSLLDTFKRNNKEEDPAKASQDPAVSLPKSDTTKTGADFDEDQIPAIVDQIFSQAIRMKASDIHFKPEEDHLLVYFRIDGALHLHQNFCKIYHHPIIARIKIISGLK